jgi:hypothetical protein
MKMNRHITKPQPRSEDAGRRQGQFVEKGAEGYATA